MRKTTTTIAIIAAATAGAGAEHLRHSKTEKTQAVPVAKEQQVSIDQDRYKAILGGKLKVLGGMAAEQEVTAKPRKTNPEKATQEIIGSIGSYVLALRKQDAQGKLPKGVTVKTEYDDGNLEITRAKIKGDGEDGVRKVELIALYNPKNTLGGKHGLGEGDVSVMREMADGSTYERNAGALRYKIPRVNGGKKYWQIGNSVSTYERIGPEGEYGRVLLSDGTVDSMHNDGLTNVHRTQVALDTEQVVDSALTHAKQIITDLREQQR